jgi:hypothetical protein
VILSGIGIATFWGCLPKNSVFSVIYGSPVADRT